VCDRPEERGPEQDVDVEWDATEHHGADLARVTDGLERVGVEQQQISDLSLFDRPELVGAPRKVAGSKVAARIASIGESPASTSSASSL
jgi:hypothetical protein